MIVVCAVVTIHLVIMKNNVFFIFFLNPLIAFNLNENLSTIVTIPPLYSIEVLEKKEFIDLTIDNFKNKFQLHEECLTILVKSNTPWDLVVYSGDDNNVSNFQIKTEYLNEFTYLTSAPFSIYKSQEPTNGKVISIDCQRILLDWDSKSTHNWTFSPVFKVMKLNIEND